jgi:hypothetical protein
MAAPILPEKIPQPHGGALLRGGVKGNAGNRMRRLVTKKAMHMVAERMPILGHIADGSVVEWSEDAQGHRTPTLTSPKPADRVKALQLLWEVANSDKKVSMAQVRARLQAQVVVIRQTLAPDVADRVLEKLADVWK